MVDHVVAHNPDWKDSFLQEARALKAALGPTQIDLHHIGSTAIDGILAKPIIDLLGTTRDLAEVDAQSDAFERQGYEVMGAFGITGRRYFRKANDAGARTHHLHVFQTGSPHIERHLAFRDFLRAHPEKAAEYSDLKARLTASGQISWDAYIDGKAPFIRVTEQDALIWYRSIRSG